MFTNVHKQISLLVIILEVNWGEEFLKERKPMIDYVKRIRDLREDHDKTQQEIADILGISQTMYARYERGANELPLRHLVKLCDYYHVSADYILGRSNKLTKK